MWGQPYIHREAYVQAKSRRPPHSFDPPTEHYAGLVTTARSVARDNFVVMAAADFDYRLVVLNWYAHARRVGIRNAFVLSMDTDLHEDLRRRRVPSVDNAANTDAWNTTCLQRHIQRTRLGHRAKRGQHDHAQGHAVGARCESLATDSPSGFHTFLRAAKLGLVEESACRSAWTCGLRPG